MNVNDSQNTNFCVGIFVFFAIFFRMHKHGGEICDFFLAKFS